MRTPINFRLSDEAVEILEGVSKRLGVTKTAIVEMALREYVDLREAAKEEERLAKVGA